MVLISLHYGVTRLADDFCLITLSLFNLFRGCRIPTSSFISQERINGSHSSNTFSKRRGIELMKLCVVDTWAVKLVMTGTFLKHFHRNGHKLTAESCR